MTKTRGARAQLRDDILNGVYRVGTYMPSVRVLASRLGGSKSSIHNILKMLQDEGLVQLCPGRGALVCGYPSGRQRLRRFFLRPSDFGTFNYLPVAARLLEGIGVGAEMRNAEITLSFSDADSLTESIIGDVSRDVVQGVIYLQCQDYESLIFPLEKANIPYVIAHDMHGFDAVKGGIDFRELTRSATDYLLARGCRRIGIAVGPLEDFIYRECMNEFMRLRDERGFETRPEWLVSNLTQERPDPADEFFAAPELPDAVFTVRDYRARFFYEAAARHGKEIPRDLSIVSFDDATWPRAELYGLTTFREPLHELGEQAVAMLQEWVTSGVRPAGRRCVCPLIERSSVRSKL